MTIECKRRYLKIADKEAEQRLDKLLAFLEENDYGFYSMAEKSEGGHKYVQVITDIKVSATKRS